MRTATSEALRILNSTQDAVESRESQVPELDCLATSTPRIDNEEPLPPYSVTDETSNTSNTGVSFTQPKSKVTVNVVKNATSAKPMIKVDISRSESLPVQSEVTMAPEYLEEKSTPSNSFSSEDIDYSTGSYDVTPQTVSRRSESHIVVNLGPKKERKEMYDRDFYTNNTPKPPRKHYEVNTSPRTSASEESIVNRQQAVNDTENKVFILNYYFLTLF